ncbi:MAG: ATP-binding cassette domain-containing protein [Erysipelotrichaceae bacterium]|nr:ATP-binding cassette domain-containing protein [Erysipelotrichaceae bacterium]MBQ9159596.1 ATP-binding cassette domain-containing protein [Erysipelotrichaceae bacterium]MBR6724584.1 ATP-binding cassette domain-containing protein [Erysipelotrichaceae bacterium]
MIEFKNVSKTYKNGTHALQNVNLKVEDGEFVYIMGPTGSGKSTLIKLLDGEEVPSSGNVIVNNVNVGRLRKSKVYLYRRKIGVVFQDYRLLPEKTVFENVAYALEVLDLPNDKIRKRTREVLKLVDLADKANVKPRELSGGQQQRVAIARAIAKRPAILIADEPTGNLDPAMTDEMITLLEKINKEEKTTLLVVTHNDVMVEFHPKRTIRIQSGHVVDDGMRAAAYASKMKATDKPNRGETMTKEERIQALREAEEADKDYVHKPHVLSESDAQEAKFNEITMQLDAIKEISEGGEE